MAVQKLLKSVKVCQSYWQKFTATFLWTTVCFTQCVTVTVWCVKIEVVLCMCMCILL